MYSIRFKAAALRGVAALTLAVISIGLLAVAGPQSLAPAAAASSAPSACAEGAAFAGSNRCGLVKAAAMQDGAPGPSAKLYNHPFYSCTRNFYVATTGSDSNSGTAASPWQTIQHADDASRQGGDCINVAPGKYNADVLIQNGGKAPTKTGYVVYRCASLDACEVIAPYQGHVWGFEKGGNFVVVDGFAINGNNAQPGGIGDSCFGTDDETYGAGNASHHLWFLNNIIHNCNLSGFTLSGKEWYYVIHNTVYDNSFTSGAQGSGIGFVVIECIEAGNPSCYAGSTYVPSGMDLTYAPPFHNVINSNRVHNNMIAANNGVGCGNHTDGNGIIMDSFLDLQTQTILFPYASLIEGNASYANGGHGIHIYRAANIAVANNTVYGNGTDTCISSYYLGDLSESGGSDNTWVNNISFTVQTPPNPGCGPYCGDRNSPLVAGNGGGVTDTDIVWANNITDGGLGVQVFDNDLNVPYFSCTDNLCTTDPLMKNPAAHKFTLQPNSPAIGYVTPEPYLFPGTADAGAYK